jgi:hypothetical protein
MTTLYFCSPSLKFSLSSLKEIENQPKTCENFWLGIIRLVTLHSLKKGEETTEKSGCHPDPERSEGEGRKIFESWEATASRFYIGTIGKSSEINSI